MYKMQNPYDKWSQPGWKIEQKYGNKVLIGNWVEEKLQFARECKTANSSNRLDYIPHMLHRPDVVMRRKALRRSETLNRFQKSWHRSSLGLSIRAFPQGSYFLIMMSRPPTTWCPCMMSLTGVRPPPLCPHCAPGTMTNWPGSQRGQTTQSKAPLLSLAWLSVGALVWNNSGQLCLH
nr:uncharacterized protein C1orf158 homolog isoform X2 [Danio rerio]|eukprot:XP_009304375.1 uncharacterized protein C1orf158 homolog isoform X2 [Danio rerio]